MLEKINQKDFEKLVKMVKPRFVARSSSMIKMKPEIEEKAIYHYNLLNPDDPIEKGGKYQYYYYVVEGQGYLSFAYSVLMETLESVDFSKYKIKLDSPSFKKDSIRFLKEARSIFEDHDVDIFEFPNDVNVNHFYIFQNWLKNIN